MVSWTSFVEKSLKSFNYAGSADCSTGFTVFINQTCLKFYPNLHNFILSIMTSGEILYRKLFARLWFEIVLFDAGIWANIGWRLGAKLSPRNWSKGSIRVKTSLGSIPWAQWGFNIVAQGIHAGRVGLLPMIWHCCQYEHFIVWIYLMGLEGSAILSLKCPTPCLNNLVCERLLRLDWSTRARYLRDLLVKESAQVNFIWPR